MMRILLFVSLCAMYVMPAMAQEHQEDVPFNGLISDITGQPLKGANIWVHDHRRYARSDRKGRFGLTNVEANDTLHIKYRKQMYDIPVAGRRSINIKLADQGVQSCDEDEELVYLGYGYVRKRECTASRGGISGEELRRSGATTILGALQGRIAGLYVTSSNRFGLGGEEVNIRGINSLNLPSTPLYVVDGVVVDSLDSISLYDVDYVEVLKDANIYGSRGANGAIIVHTKRGPK